MDRDQKHFHQVGLADEIPVPGFLPRVVKYLQAVDLLLKILGELIVKPLCLLVMPECNRESYTMLVPWIELTSQDACEGDNKPHIGVCALKVRAILQRLKCGDAEFVVGDSDHKSEYREDARE